uniref:Uncharacterized protein n=1 Tax=Arundo donax TaxID=35708 RepID=A0A0A9HKM0_ARUDO
MRELCCLQLLTRAPPHHCECENCRPCELRPAAGMDPPCPRADPPCSGVDPPRPGADLVHLLSDGHGFERAATPVPEAASLSAARRRCRPPPAATRLPLVRSQSLPIAPQDSLSLFLCVPICIIAVAM